jgi:ABC-type branched-subunit amino acid transport system permease subunit
VATPNPLDRPAFYALRPGGWRDLLTVLHPPYTAWHLSYVAFGAVAAPELHGDRLAATLLAFFLAVGIAAHAFDELNGRPLRTQLSDGVLFVMGALALAGAVAIGIVGAVTVSLGLLAFIAVGAFIVVAYNFELFGGRFHSDFWFAAAWGAFPALTGYWINALQFRLQGVLVAAACFALSLAQRGLSTRVRELRRRTVYVSGEQRLADGTTIELDAARLAAPFDDALRACAVGLTLLATGLVIARL